MKIPFRQGLVNFARTGDGQPMFLKVNASRNYIDIVAIKTPVTVAFAHGKSDYILTEPTNVDSAWGPIAGVKTWLFWDIDTLTGKRTYGTTTIAPVVGAVAPKVLGQHWFDTATTTMKVWTGHTWLPKIRVFAGTYDGVTLTPNVGGTQAGIRVGVTAGRIIFDANGKPVNKRNGEFFTTEDNFLVHGETSSTVNLEQGSFIGKANEPIPAYSVVKFTDVGWISLAEYEDIENVALAMSTTSVNTNEVGSLVFGGIVTNPYWNFQTLNAPLWVKGSGEVSEEEEDNGKKPPIGRVLSPTSMLFNPYSRSAGAIGDGAKGDKGDKGDPGDVGPPGPRGLPGADSVVAGPTGAKGDTGAVGAKGDKGDKGDTPVIDYEAIIAAVLDRLELPSSQPGTLEIVGPETITERSNGTYTVTLKIGTGPAVTVPVSIKLTGENAAINNNGLLTTQTMATDGVSLVLEAEYLYNGTVIKATKEVIVTKIAPTLLTVTGLTNTFPNETRQLVTIVKYADGVTKTVTTAATYMTSNAGAGTVNLVGLFTAKSVTANTPITVTATYVEGEHTLSANISATVLLVIPVGMNLTMTVLTGANGQKINEGGTAQFAAVITMNDGTSVTVVPSWAVSAANVGSINTNGLFTAALQSSGEATGNVNATIVYQGVALQATKAVTVADVPVVTTVFPYYGLISKTTQLTATTVTGLQNRGTAANRTGNFTLDAGTGTSGTYMVYAYPVSYGLATFLDTSTNFTGGWDGAGGDYTDPSKDGPITVNVTVNGTSIPFYVYKTSRAGIGVKTWTVS